MRVLFTAAIVLTLIVGAVAVVWGCILNIFELVTGYATMSLVEVALRVVGIFVPIIGTFFGWF